MNKTELIAEVAAKCAISKKDAEKTVNATFDTIAEALCKGDKVQLVGFGGFETKHREAQYGPQPQNEGAGRDPRDDRSCLQGRQGSEGQGRQVICLDINAQLCRRASKERLVKLCDDAY